VTWLYFVAWAVVVSFYGVGLLEASPAAWLSEPGRAAVRIANRDLEIANVLPELSTLEAVLLDRSTTSRASALDQAIEIQRDVLRHAGELRAIHTLEPDLAGPAGAPDTRRVRAHLAALLAERGDLDEALAVAGRAGSGLEGLLRAAYRGGPPPGDPEPLRGAGLEGYTRERLRAALARAEGDDARAAEIDAALAARGRARLHAGQGLYLANVALVAAGGIAIGVAALRRRPLGGSAPRALPWSAADGLGVLVRGDLWNRLYFVGLGELASRLGRGGPVDALVPPPLELVLFHGATAIAALPLLALTWRHLLRPHAASFGVFGGLPGTLVPLVLGAIAVDLAGTHGIAWATWWLGFGGHWAEGFDEALVFGSRTVAAATALDYTVFTPFLEELAFRGLLYTALRQRLGVAPAALAGSAVFAGLHFYTLPGFLMTFWSGLVWSLVYERSGSLWPGIAAHAAYNALFVAGLLVVHR